LLFPFFFLNFFKLQEIGLSFFPFPHSTLQWPQRPCLPFVVCRFSSHSLFLFLHYCFVVKVFQNPFISWREIVCIPAFQPHFPPPFLFFFFFFLMPDCSFQSNVFFSQRSQRTWEFCGVPFFLFFFIPAFLPCLFLRGPFPSSSQGLSNPFRHLPPGFFSSGLHVFLVSCPWSDTPLFLGGRRKKPVGRFFLGPPRLSPLLAFFSSCFLRVSAPFFTLACVFFSTPPPLGPFSLLSGLHGLQRVFPGFGLPNFFFFDLAVVFSSPPLSEHWPCEAMIPSPSPFFPLDLFSGGCPPVTDPPQKTYEEVDP